MSQNKSKKVDNNLPMGLKLGEVGDVAKPYLKSLLWVERLSIFRMKLPFYYLAYD